MTEYDYYSYTVKMYREAKNDKQKAYYKAIIDDFKRRNSNKLHSSFTDVKYIGKAEKHYG